MGNDKCFYAPSVVVSLSAMDQLCVSVFNVGVISYFSTNGIDYWDDMIHERPKTVGKQENLGNHPLNPDFKAVTIT